MKKANGKMRKKSILFFSILVTLIFTNILVANADEIIISNTGEESTLIESDANTRSQKAVEGYAPRTRLAVNENQTQLPEDIGLPRTPSGFDYAFDPNEPVIKSRAIQRNRQKVSNPNVYPYCASLLIICDWNTGSGTLRAHGSGSMIGANKVVTAAHVLYDHKYGWADTVRVYPAVKNNYTDFDFAYGSMMYTYAGYIQAKPLSISSQQRDVAIVKLNHNLGNTTGWFGFTTNRSSNLRLNGYDGDIDGGRSLVTRAGSGTWLEDGILKYPWETVAGSSGGGVYNPNNNQLEANHAYGYSNHNGGAKINSNIFDFMNRY